MLVGMSGGARVRAGRASLRGLAGLAVATSLAGGPSPASAQGRAIEESACRFEKPFRTPLHLLRWLPPGVRAVTVEGRFDMDPGRALDRPDRYSLRDESQLGGPVAVQPVEPLAPDFGRDAEFLRGRLLEVTACLGTRAPGDSGNEVVPILRFHAYAVIPERDRERPPREVELSALRDGAFDGRRVLVRGVLAGRRHGSLRLSSRLSESDWVLAAGEDAAWMRGRPPRGEGFALDPDDTADHGRGLAVVGVVGWWRDAPVLHVESVRMTRAVAGGLDAALFALPLGQRLDPAQPTIEIRFSAPMDEDTFAGRVELLDASGASLEVRWVYDPEWWSLLVSPLGPIAAGTTVELRLLGGIASAEGDGVRPDPEAPEGTLLVRRYQVS